MGLTLAGLAAFLDITNDIRKGYIQDMENYTAEIVKYTELANEQKEFQKKILRSGCEAAKKVLESDNASDRIKYYRYKAYCYSVDKGFAYEDVVKALKAGILTEKDIDKKYWWEE